MLVAFLVSIMATLGGQSAPAPHAVIVVDGNSLSVPQGDIEHWPNCTNCGFGWPTWLAYLLNGQADVVGVALPGATTPILQARAPSVVDPHYADPGQIHVLILWEFSNDLCVGATPSDAMRHYASYVADRHGVGWKVIVASAIPHVDSACPGALPHFDNVRVRANTQLRLGWQSVIGADGFVDLAGADKFLYADSWGRGPWSNVVPTFTLPLYLPDNVHLTDFGARYVAEIVGQSSDLLQLLR